MNEYLINLVDKFPSWLIWLLTFLLLMVKWGPGFILKYIEVTKKYRDMSDEIKKEYIADLEK